MAPPAQPTTSTPAPATNPANAPGAVLSDRPHRGVIAAERARAGRGETLRMLEAGQLDASKPSVAPQVTTAPRQPAPARATDPEPEEPAEPTEEPVEDPAPEIELPAAAAQPDPEASKRVAQIQQAELRAKANVAKARAELEERTRAIETEWAPKVKAAKDFADLMAKAAKARSNPALLVDVFRALGFSEDHYEPVAQTLYSMSKAGQADPQRRAQAEKLLRDREGMDELAATQRRLDELENKLSERDHQGEFAQLQGEYLGNTIASIGDEHPIARAVLAKATGGKTPAERAAAASKMKAFRGKLWDITVELTNELGGDAPDFADVITRYETMRRAELEELGVAPPTAIDPKKNGQSAGKKTPAQTLSVDLSTPRVPRTNAGGREHRDETRRMLEAGQLE